MVDKETAEKKVIEICTKYNIVIKNNIVQKPSNHLEIGKKMLMNYMGLAYTIGCMQYDNKEEDKEKMKMLSGEFNVLKNLLYYLEYPPFIELIQIKKNAQKNNNNTI